MKLSAILFYGSLVFAKQIGAVIYLIAVGDLADLDFIGAILNTFPR